MSWTPWRDLTLSLYMDCSSHKTLSQLNFFSIRSKAINFDNNSGMAPSRWSGWPRVHRREDLWWLWRRPNLLQVFCNFFPSVYHYINAYASSSNRSVYGTSLADHLEYYGVDLEADAWGSCKALVDASVSQYYLEYNGSIILWREPTTPHSKIVSPRSVSSSL